MVNELAIEFLDMQATFAAAPGPEPEWRFRFPAASRGSG